MRATMRKPSTRCAREVQVVEGYLRRVDALLPALAPERLKTACEIAALPLSMRGFGHVKLANVALARAREAEPLKLHCVRRCFGRPGSPPPRG